MTSPHPHVITVGNVKGGVGKSTTAIQLALHATRRMLRVLLVDADPGRSALSWAATAGESWPDQVAVVAHGIADPPLPRRLRTLGAGFDLVVIDTPHSPTEGTEVGPMLADAIAVADEVIVPTVPMPMDIDRLPDVVAALVAEQRRRDLAWWLLFTLVDLRWRHVPATRAELEARGIPVLVPLVRVSSGVKWAFGTAEVRPEYAAVADRVLGSRGEVTTSPYHDVAMP